MVFLKSLRDYRDKTVHFIGLFTRFFSLYCLVDYQEKYQELLEREDFFPDYEENGTDLSGAGDP